MSSLGLNVSFKKRLQLWKALIVQGCKQEVTKMAEKHGSMSIHLTIPLYQILSYDPVILAKGSFSELLLCSHSPNGVSPEPQRNVPIAVVRGAVCPSNHSLSS